MVSRSMNRSSNMIVPPCVGWRQDHGRGTSVRKLCCRDTGDFSCPSRTVQALRHIIRFATYVEEAVEDGVAEGGIADDLVPVLDGDLADQQRAGAGVAVVEDFQKVVSPPARERKEPQSSKTRSQVLASRCTSLG